jgi:hypothetical protein
VLHLVLQVYSLSLTHL